MASPGTKRGWATTIDVMMSGGSVEVPVARDLTLDGDLVVPGAAPGLVVFCQARGIGLATPADLRMIEAVQRAGFATMVVDLLPGSQTGGPHSEQAGLLLLTERLLAVVDWTSLRPEVGGLPLGLFGSGLGAAAALTVAGHRARRVRAVVASAGRLDLAVAALSDVVAPVLLVVEAGDTRLLEANRAADRLLQVEHRLELLDGVAVTRHTTGPSPPGTESTIDWFRTHLVPPLR